MWPFRSSKVPTAVKAAPRRARRSYDAAIRTATSSDWTDSRYDAARELRDALEMVRSASREAERNNGLYRRAIEMVVAYTVGDRGVALQSTTTNAFNDEPDRVARDLIERAFGRWATSRVTLDGRLDWIGFLELCCRSWIRDGEIFVRLIWRDGRLHLQPLEGDMVPVRFDDVDRGIVSGIEMDADGRPVAYHVARQHPGMTGWGVVGQPDTLRIPADQIVHLYRAERVGQVRGMPFGTAGLSDLRVLNGYIGAELKAARMNAARPAVITKDPNIADEYTGDGDTENDDEPLVIDMSESGVTQLPEGHRFEWSPATHPADAFSPFVNAVLRQFCATMGVSHALLSRDLSQVNWSSLRVESQDTNRFFGTLQRHLIQTLVVPIFGAWLRTELMAGRISSGKVVLRASDFERHRQAHWIAQPFPSIDQKADLAEARERIRLGVSTLSRECVRLTGVELDLVIAERKREREMLRRAGLLDVQEAEMSIATQKVLDQDGDGRPDGLERPA